MAHKVLITLNFINSTDLVVVIATAPGYRYGWKEGWSGNPSRPKKGFALIALA